MSRISFKARDLKLSKGAGFKGYIDFKSKNLLFSDKNLAYDIINQNIKDKDDKYIVIGDKALFEDVIEVKRSVAGSLYQSNMTMLEIALKGYYDILDEWIEYKREIASNLINDGESEWIDYGLFKVTQCDYNDEDETTQIVAFDKMIETQKEYKQEDIQLTFPTTVYNVFDRVLQVCDLETTTTTFPNSDELITEDVWENAEYTYRDVLSHIAQVTGSIIGVRDNKVEIYQPIETEFKITQNKLNKLQMGDYYGKINILNLTREPQHDNYAYPEDFNSIPQSERKELVFENNPIVDKERERWAPLIFPLVNDLEYREFTADAFVGYGIFEVGDIVTVEEYNTGKEYKCLITEEYTVHRHGLSSEIKSNKPFTSKEQYVVVTDERREGQKTYILVDQLNGQIILATEKIDELEDKATELELDIDGLMASVESIHNGNVIPNLNGEFGYTSWSGDGELLYYDDLVYHDDLMYTHTFVPKLMDNSMSQWGISFYGTNTTGKGYIIPDTYYSFRAKVHKYKPFDVDVLEYDKNQDLIGTTTFNFSQPQTYVTFKITPKENTYNIALKFKPIGASIDDRLELTEMMFNRGEPKEWFEGTMDVKLYAESRVSMLDDKILLESQRVDGLNNDIHNAGVEINAVDGITTYGKHFRVMDSDRTKSLLEVVTVAGEEQLLIDINNGSVGNFSIKDGVMEFTTPEYFREYTRSDANYVRNILIGQVQATSEDMLIYDLNNDGMITIGDFRIIDQYLQGKVDINKTVKTNIKIGTSNGKIIITNLYENEDGEFIEGDKTVIAGNEVKARNISVNSVYTDTLSIAGKVVEIDSNGFLKAVNEVIQGEV